MTKKNNVPGLLRIRNASPNCLKKNLTPSSFNKFFRAVQTMSTFFAGKLNCCRGVIATQRRWSWISG